MTHADLIPVAKKWLINSKGCSFAFTELCCSGYREIPDAIGFRQGFSILVECKVSRSDFLSDKKKLFRQYHPCEGCGRIGCAGNALIKENLF